MAAMLSMADLRRKNGREAPWRVKWWGVGNENWGCGGNMRPECYADQYRRYSTYCCNYGDAKLYKIACGANQCGIGGMPIIACHGFAGVRVVTGIRVQRALCAIEVWRGSVGIWPS